MSAYEYVRIEVDFGDLSELNRFSADGWRVVWIVEAIRNVDARIRVPVHIALLEREARAPQPSALCSECGQPLDKHVREQGVISYCPDPPSAPKERERE